jgi:hypothetical protein
MELKDQILPWVMHSQEFATVKFQINNSKTEKIKNLPIQW